MQNNLTNELLPMATIVAVLVNPTSAIAEPFLRALHPAAHTLGLQLQIRHDHERASSQLDQGYHGRNNANPRYQGPISRVLPLRHDAFDSQSLTR